MCVSVEGERFSGLNGMKMKLLLLNELIFPYTQTSLSIIYFTIMFIKTRREHEQEEDDDKQVFRLVSMSLLGYILPNSKTLS